MRIWSLHPQYLDAAGLVAVWREALLAQAVLRGRTRGYRNHPQLERFRNHQAPRAMIAEFLRGVHTESVQRGYQFNAIKIGRTRSRGRISVTRGQIEFEFEHLLRKLRSRDTDRYRQLSRTDDVKVHPVFRVVEGSCETWERDSRVISR